MVQKKNDVCPNCGHCPHCGQSPQRLQPYNPWYPYVPFTPIYPTPWINPPWTVTWGGTSDTVSNIDLLPHNATQTFTMGGS